MGEGASGGRPFPAEGIRDSANWKELEQREQEGGGDYLRWLLPGAGLLGGDLRGARRGGGHDRSLGLGARGRRPTEQDTQR